MKNLFNGSRLALLLKRDFYIQYKTYLLALSAIFCVLLVFNFLAIATGQADGFNLVFYPLTLFIGGFLFTSLAFQELATARGRMFYVNIPASNFEKILSKLFITGPCYVIVSLLLYFIFSLLVYILTNLVLKTAHPVFNPLQKSIWHAIQVYLVLHSVFLLGSISFKKNALLKTILALSGLGLFLLLFLALVLYSFHFFISLGEQYYISFRIFDIHLHENMAVPVGLSRIGQTIQSFIHIFFWYLLAPLMWLVSYFKLKEIEV